MRHYIVYLTLANHAAMQCYKVAAAAAAAAAVPKPRWRHQKAPFWFLGNVSIFSENRDGGRWGIHSGSSQGNPVCFGAVELEPILAFAREINFGYPRMCRGGRAPCAEWWGALLTQYGQNECHSCFFFQHIILKKYLLNTSPVSSIRSGSILIFASCLAHRPLVRPTDVVRVNTNSKRIIPPYLLGRGFYSSGLHFYVSLNQFLEEVQEKRDP